MYDQEANDILEPLGLTGRILEADLVVIYLGAVETTLRKKSKECYDNNDFANSFVKQAHAEFAGRLIDCINNGDFDGDNRRQIN